MRKAQETRGEGFFNFLDENEDTTRTTRQSRTNRSSTLRRSFPPPPPPVPRMSSRSIEQPSPKPEEKLPSPSPPIRTPSPIKPLPIEKEPTPSPSLPNKPTHSTTSSSLKNTTKALLALLTITVAVFAFLLLTDPPIPYCDSNTLPSISNECLPCPPNGICSNGTLTCSKFYIQQKANTGLGNVCVRDERVVTKARGLLDQVATDLRVRYGELTCNPSDMSGLTEEHASKLLEERRYFTDNLSSSSGSFMEDNSSSASITKNHFSIESIRASMTLNEIGNIPYVKKESDASFYLLHELLTNVDTLTEYGLASLQTLDDIYIVPMAKSEGVVCLTKRFMSNHLLEIIFLSTLGMILMGFYRSYKNKKEKIEICKKYIQTNSFIDSDGLAQGPTAAAIFTLLDEDQSQVFASIEECEALCDYLVRIDPNMNKCQFVGTAAPVYWCSHAIASQETYEERKRSRKRHSSRIQSQVPQNQKKEHYPNIEINTISFVKEE